MTKLRIENLQKSFVVNGRPLRVLDGLHMTVEAGEFVSVIGYSGCGKSTLLRMIAGLEKADGGQIIIDGTPVTAPRGTCKMMFQSACLLPWLTVADNVMFGLRGTKAARRETAERYLLLTGLADFAQAYPAQLSGGMAQRAALARCLASQPDLLLLDEPLAALDALTRAALQAELKRLARESGLTAVLVTHDPEEAVFLSSRVLVMTRRPGRIGEEISVCECASCERGSEPFCAAKRRLTAALGRQDESEPTEP